MLRAEEIVAEAMRGSWDAEVNPARTSISSSTSSGFFFPLVRVLPPSPRIALPAAICSAFLSFSALLFSVRYT